ncbi:solute carrier family 52, riboflavin transporter, member 3 isoform X2 [Erythrolamprus reginae]|uniref:solute carrier family 52, riboflavin transporter, member 3 isoform X2 n=1 Tax=Erythrolamprus reginae TaxID=121349 RepID=UPI00396CE8F1
MGMLACFLLAFLWHYTTPIAGEPHSLAFFVLTFFLSLVDCTSSVTFLPFMVHFHPRLVPTLFIGEGLSGFIPAIFALVQGAGIASCVRVPAPTSEANSSSLNATEVMETRYSPPNFSSLVFFLILSAMMLFCLVAFFFLNRQAKSWEQSTQNLCSSQITLNSVQKFPAGKEEAADGKRVGEENHGVEKVTYTVSKLAFIYFLVAWLNALTNGVLPSVQSYSCLPYGNLAYHLAATLSSIANPLACTVATFLPNRSLLFLGILTAVGTAFGAYNMAMAVLSPCPLLQHSDWGDALIVISWVSFTGTLTYVKVMLGIILRTCSHNALVWYGVGEQLGSLVGALLMFPLVNVYHFFKSADFCSFQCPA